MAAGSEQKKVLHIITRIIVGGAQINTMYSCDLIEKPKYAASILTGPQTGPEGSIENEIRSRNIPLHIMPELVRQISPVNDFIALFKILVFIKKHRFDVVHTHSSKAGILGRVAAFIARTPVIVHTVHGWGFNDKMAFYKKHFYIILERILAPITDKLITVSDLNTEKGLEFAIGKKSKYSTIHSGIDIEYFKAMLPERQKVRNELGIKENELVVGTVSRLSEQKAPEVFIEVAKRITEKHENVKFVFVGGGPLEAKCMALIAEYKLQDKVLLLGLRKDAARLLSSFDIFILTSLWEGLPRVFAEAMSLNLPIVATNIDGAPQAVHVGKNGFLVPVGDVDGFVAKLSLLIENKELRQKFSDYANKVILPKFCVRQMVKDIEKVYEEFLGE